MQAADNDADDWPMLSSIEATFGRFMQTFIQNSCWLNIEHANKVFSWFAPILATRYFLKRQTDTNYHIIGVTESFYKQHFRMKCTIHE